MCLPSFQCGIPQFPCISLLLLNANRSLDEVKPFSESMLKRGASSLRKTRGRETEEGDPTPGNLSWTKESNGLHPGRSSLHSHGLDQVLLLHYIKLACYSLVVAGVLFMCIRLVFFIHFMLTWLLKCFNFLASRYSCPFIFLDVRKAGCCAIHLFVVMSLF